LAILGSTNTKVAATTAIPIPIPISCRRRDF
jgi:hypothetical protein